MELPKFTLIGATTRIGLISIPSARPLWRYLSPGVLYAGRRLGKNYFLGAGKILKMDIEHAREAATELSKRSRFTPRIANPPFKAG